MYYCELNEKRENGITRSEEDFWLHYLHCTCFHCQTWYYFMGAQDDHVRAYCEHCGFVETQYRNSMGVTLHFPKGLVEYFDWKRNDNTSSGYPY